MNSTAIGNWIQLVTGLSVVVGLALVIWELQQNREATISALTSDYYQIASQERASIFGEHAADALARACHQPTELTEAELVVLDQVYGGILDRLDRMSFLARRSDFYSENQWREAIGLLDVLFMSRAGRAYWQSVAGSYVLFPEIRDAGNEYLVTWDKPQCHDEHAAWMAKIRESGSNR